LAPIAAPTVMMAVSANAGALRSRRSECFTLRETRRAVQKFGRHSAAGRCLAA
jgi:hypothetical protein